MSETVEGRLARLEREVAIVAERYGDMRQRVSDLSMTAATVIELKVGLATLQTQLSEVRRDLAERDKDVVADRRASRSAIYGMTTAIMATIIGAVITLLIASPH